MGFTVVEKIAAARAGDAVDLVPDHVMTHDNSMAVIEKFRALGGTRVADPRMPVVEGLAPRVWPWMEPTRLEGLAPRGRMAMGGRLAMRGRDADPTRFAAARRVPPGREHVPRTDPRVPPKGTSGYAVPRRSEITTVHPGAPAM